MIVDLTGFFDDGDNTKTVDGEIDTSNIDFPKLDVDIVSPIKFNGVIYKISDYYALDLKISFKINADCDRCLKPLDNTVDTQLFGKLVNNHVESQIDDEEFEEHFLLEKNRIDLKKYILEQVISSIPMKSLCDDDCKGLCQSCGVDLNIETCDCDNNIIDPRLEKLKELFPEK